MTNAAPQGLPTRVVSEKEVSIEDIVSEASGIWRELKSRKLAADDHAAGEAFFNEMSKKHPEFSKSYSLVLRYIAEMRLFSAGVFAKWLKQVQARPWKSSDEYFETQANYVMMLYVHYNPKAPTADRYSVRNNVKKMLSQEYEDFKQTTQKYEKLVNERDEKLAAKNKADMLEYCRNAPPEELALAGTFRVEVDESITSLSHASGVLDAPTISDPLIDMSAADLLS